MKTSQHGLSRDQNRGKRADQQRGIQTEAVRGGRSGLSGMKPMKEVGADGTNALCESGAMGGTNTEGIGIAEAM